MSKKQNKSLQLTKQNYEPFTCGKETDKLAA